MLAKEPSKRPSIEEILKLGFIKKFASLQELKLPFLKEEILSINYSEQSGKSSLVGKRSIGNKTLKSLVMHESEKNIQKNSMKIETDEKFTIGNKKVIKPAEA